MRTARSHARTMAVVGVTLAVMLTAPCANAINPLLREFEDAFIELSKRVGPAVVEIAADSESSEGDVEEFFRFFNPDGEQEDGEEEAPPQNAPTPPRRTATGSGFVYDRFGHIVTNNHVVDEATKLTVSLSDGTEHEAVVIGTDASTDIAVIKIDPAGIELPVANLGDSDNLQVGQFAIAMGSPRGLTGSVSFGHISGLGRERLRLPDSNLRFQNFIQTDAAINQGNSGGPLCDIEGDVIGVNIAMVFGASSIGFAIPINRVKQIVPELIDSGRVVRGWLGVSIMDINDAAEIDGVAADNFVQAYNLPDARGAFVQRVTWRGPAEEAQLQKEDVIREMDGAVIDNTIDLINRVSGERPGTVIDMTVWRSGKQISVPITVREFPGMQAARFGYDVIGIHVLDFNDISEVLDAPKETFGIDDSTQGVLVTAVVPKSSAAEEGITPGDIIEKVAHEEFLGNVAFKELMENNAEPGKTVLLHVKKLRGEVERKFLKIPDDYVKAQY